MSNLSKCSADVEQKYRAVLTASQLSTEEANVLVPVISALDVQDGNCDAKISASYSESLNEASDYINGLSIGAIQKRKLHVSLTRFLPDAGFSNFVSQPYHVLLGFLEKNPLFAGTILPLIYPHALWDNMDGKSYSDSVDALISKSGLATLNRLISKAEIVKRLESTNKPDTSVFQVKPEGTSSSASSIIMLGAVALPRIPDTQRIDPALLPELLRHKALAEKELVNVWLEEAEKFPDGFRKDPLTYWVPLAKLAALEQDGGAEVTGAHLESMGALYAKAKEYAYDPVMRILFAVGMADFRGSPVELNQFDAYIEQVKREIRECSDAETFSLPNGEVESRNDRIARYYSVIGHLLGRKYATAISAFTPDVQVIAKIESDVDQLLHERRDKTSVDEALVYGDTVGLIGSVWAAEGGPMTQALATGGLSRSRAELERLSVMLRRFEALCNGHFLNPIGGPQLKEKMADVSWNILGEAYFRAGLPKQGLINLESATKKLQITISFRNHIAKLSDRYPWLVDQSGKINLTNVGQHGEEAYQSTKAMFFVSNDSARETLLPVATAALGSLGGPVGTVAGGYAGKVTNRIINTSSEDAITILDQSRQTGIPLISKAVSEQLNDAENIDLAMCGVASLVMFRFYRSAVSLTGHATKSSFDFVMRGGLSSSARSAVSFFTRNSLNNGMSAAGKVIMSAPHVVAKDVPQWIRAIPEMASAANGKTGVLSVVKYLWDNHGVPIRLASATGLMAWDYVPDQKFNTWSGPLGASLLINDLYGKYIWGWNPNAGMVGFVWRYGFELGVQAMQGIPITNPRMDYTVVGMLASYTTRGANKLYTLGRAETHTSPLLTRLARFVETHNVIVPQSVVGRSHIKLRNGLAKGLLVRVGKPATPLSAALPDGTILSVEIIGKGNGHYRVRVLQKMTDTAGNPITAASEITAPRASALGRWLSRTIHYKLNDSNMYKAGRWLLDKINLTPKWFETLGKKASTPTKPIFNMRGSLANAGDLPVMALAAGLFANFQDADPRMAGLYKAADSGINFVFQHKIQHMMKIDGGWSTSIGYLLGIPISILSLPTIFPTLINKAPNIIKPEKGYFARLDAGDYAGATGAMQAAVTSLCFMHNIPVLGGFWNQWSPFGSVDGSNARIEEAGAVAYWRHMYTKLAESAENEAARVTMRHFIDKVTADSEKYLLRRENPNDPVQLRLLILELAFVKRLMTDKTHQSLTKYIASKRVLKHMVERVPVIRTEDELRHLVTGLNMDKVVGIL